MLDKYWTHHETKRLDDGTHVHLNRVRITTPPRAVRDAYHTMMPSVDRHYKHKTAMQAARRLDVDAFDRAQLRVAGRRDPSGGLVKSMDVLRNQLRATTSPVKPRKRKNITDAQSRKRRAEIQDYLKNLPPAPVLGSELLPAAAAATTIDPTTVEQDVTATIVLHTETVVVSQGVIPEPLVDESGLPIVLAAQDL